jgi:hypothetical protein
MPADLEGSAPVPGQNVLLKWHAGALLGKDRRLTEVRGMKREFLLTEYCDLN